MNRREIAMDNQLHMCALCGRPCNPDREFNFAITVYGRVRMVHFPCGVRALQGEIARKDVSTVEVRQLEAAEDKHNRLSEVLTAVEYGYRGAEKGWNLERTIKEAQKLYE